MARWFNPRTGSFGAAFPVAGAAQHPVNAPDEDDWVLALQADAK
jgi:hypothetical protein